MCAGVVTNINRLGLDTISPKRQGPSRYRKTSHRIWAEERLSSSLPDAGEFNFSGREPLPDTCHLVSRLTLEQCSSNDKKKRSRGRLISVDTSKAKSNAEILRKCFDDLGWPWREYRTGRKIGCDLYWNALSFNDNEAVLSGKVNKFPGLIGLVRKSQLTKLLYQMKQLFPLEFSFFPTSWLIPDEHQKFYHEVMKEKEQNPNYKPTFIVKPSEGSQGEGIYLITDPNSLSMHGNVRPSIIQEYITRPLLLEKTKFDLRVYVLLASLNPLNIYISREGMARFCTMHYQQPTVKNLNQVYMHLTNYSLNKHSKDYVHTDNLDRGSKRTMKSVFRTLEANGVNTDQLWGKIEAIVVKTITSLLPDLKVCYELEIPSKRPGPSCFQILGFDILITEGLEPILLEVNANPSLRLDYEYEPSPGIVESVPSPVDEEIKIPLVMDTLKIVVPSKRLSSAKRALVSRSCEHIPSGRRRREEEEEIHFDCLEEIWPMKYSERYEHLRLIEKVAGLFHLFLGVRESQHMGATGFRNFCRRAKVCVGSLTMAAVDIMYIDIVRRWKQETPAGTSCGMCFGAFLEAFFILARRRFRLEETLLGKVKSLVDFCEVNVHQGPLWPPHRPKKGQSKRLKRLVVKEENLYKWPYADNENN
ncbi:tubulin polyglutamylase TTLL11-like [Anneissia japonica]|uniref:tubulin polyglutamylase TTLL11-like n=1 Tax=Anneissia japonica TaxID=1529436 RepID=UPI0014255FB6|nr:tubulin polyglutamylase TTLL11-like [Anneissia japonica]